MYNSICYLVSNSGPTSKEELRKSLDETIKQAYENGVELDNGGYELRHDDPEIPDWEVLIYLLQAQ